MSLQKNLVMEVIMYNLYKFLEISAQRISKFEPRAGRPSYEN